MTSHLHALLTTHPTNAVVAEPEGLTSLTSQLNSTHILFPWDPFSRCPATSVSLAKIFQQASFIKFWLHSVSCTFQTRAAYRITSSSISVACANNRPIMWVCTTKCFIVQRSAFQTCVHYIFQTACFQTLLCVFSTTWAITFNTLAQGWRTCGLLGP
jgi:hypothetical protein